MIPGTGAPLGPGVGVPPGAGDRLGAGVLHGVGVVPVGVPVRRGAGEVLTAHGIPVATVLSIPAAVGQAIIAIQELLHAPAATGRLHLAHNGTSPATTVAHMALPHQLPADQEPLLRVIIADIR